MSPEAEKALLMLARIEHRLANIETCLVTINWRISFMTTILVWLFVGLYVLLAMIWFK